MTAARSGVLKFVRTALRVGFIPLFATPQDRAMIQALEQARERPYKLAMLCGFRGSRKSFVAQRCAIRSYVFRPILYPPIVYYNAAEMTPEKLDELLAGIPKQRWLRGLFEFLKQTFLCVVLGVSLCFLWGWWRGERVSLRSVILSVWDEFPSTTSVIVFVIVTLLALVRRRAVIVLDDAGSAPLRASGKVPGGRHALERISIMGEKGPTLLVTSNEGIEACFEDTADLKRNRLEWPHPDEKDLPGVLHDVASSVPKKAELRTVTAAHVRSAIAAHLEHHAFSIRWWGEVVNTAGVLRGILDNTVPPRRFL
jgi:hypothetical protein